MIELCSFSVLICPVHLTVCPCHDTHVFQSESTLYSCLNVNGWRVELLNIRLNAEVLLYELSASGFQSGSSHLNFRFHASFKQGVPWHSGRYRVWIPSETRTWHHKNLQSNALHRQVLRTQLDHLASLTD